MSNQTQIEEVVRHIRKMSTLFPPSPFMTANPTIPVMAERIQKDDYGRFFYLAEATSDGELCLDVMAPSAFTGVGDAWRHKPVAELPVGTIVHSGRGSRPAPLYRVVAVGEPYSEMRDVCVLDEDRSYSGWRPTGQKTIIHLQRVYVEDAGQAEEPLMVEGLKAIWNPDAAKALGLTNVTTAA